MLREIQTYEDKRVGQTDSTASRAPIPLPDYEYGTIEPEFFRKTILDRGAVMLRNAADKQVLEKTQRALTNLFAQYANVPASEMSSHLASSDPEERNFWEQINLSHIFDRTFKGLAGFSYFDIIRSCGIWDFATRAFPESPIIESTECNSRRVTEKQLQQFWDHPLEFHVDAQFFFNEKLERTSMRLNLERALASLVRLKPRRTLASLVGRGLPRPAFPENALSINFWTPLTSCGIDAPSLKVILLGVRETKEYLEYNPVGYEPGPRDTKWMHQFRCHKMGLSALEEHNLLQYSWAPEFRAGDILAFTNFTMHATHYTKLMTRPRTSVEVRIDLPSALY